MKKNFLTGLALILPLTITLFFVAWIIDLLTSPFQNIVERALSNYNVIEGTFFIFSKEQMLYLFGKIIILFCIASFLCFVGFFAKLFITNSLLSLADWMIGRIPFVRTLYKKIQEIVNTVFSSKGKAFSDVVFAPFPSKGIYTLGLVPQETLHEKNSLTRPEETSVFIPGSPNPTGGFMISCSSKDLIYLDMKVEEAVKFIVSCGMISMEFNVKK